MDAVADDAADARCKGGVAGADRLVANDLLEPLQTVEIVYVRGTFI